MHNNVQLFLLAYLLLSYLKKCFYSDFGPSALQLRMEKTVVIFACYHMLGGRHARAPHIEAL